MDQRVQFIADYQRDVFNVADLARRFGISRKTAYKWIDPIGPGRARCLRTVERRGVFQLGSSRLSRSHRVVPRSRPLPRRDVHATGWEIRGGSVPGHQVDLD